MPHSSFIGNANWIVEPLPASACVAGKFFAAAWPNLVQRVRINSSSALPRLTEEGLFAASVRK